MAQLWQVVGGGERGGIVVRTECDLNSAQEDARLANESVVRELALHDSRLHYELVCGTGPAKGWVTTRLRDKDLLVKHRVEEEAIITLPPCGHCGREQKPDKPRFSRCSMCIDEELDAAVYCCRACQKEDWPAHKAWHQEMRRLRALEADKEPSAEEKEALRQYIEKFGESRDGRHEGFHRKVFAPFAHSKEKKTPAEALEAAIAFKGQQGQSQSQKKERKPKLWDTDSDGEDIPLCSQCYLPVGEFAHAGKLANTCIHAECMAQVIAHEGQAAEFQRAKKENAKKLKNRLEFDIGWTAEKVPSNSVIAEKLGCSPLPQGLCCLVYDEAAKTVNIAATHEPSASINLEYLLLALKVRKDRCREPLFSLDPVDPQKMDKTPQVKRYEPAWLAGTSVGDVMFEADYFLKELGFGEYEMPVAGMLSVFDWSELEDDDHSEWAAREWFVVKKAEVRMAQDKTLIPHVKMGVEAREQVLTSHGLDDKPVTSSDHPCKKFADAFTRNFDLIAERKSVIFHLRELAKASVMAKFLVDSEAKIDRSWYRLADQIVRSTKPEAHPEIPQLWNMRGNGRIQLKDGRLVNTATGLTSKLRAIYGGVQFGLDKFELQQRSALQGSQLGAPPMQGMQLGARQPMFMPQRFQQPPAQFQPGQRPPFQPGQRPAPEIGMGVGMGAPSMQGMQMGTRQPFFARGEVPQGVDLNLDKFSLAAPERMSNSLPPCSSSLDSLEGRVGIGRAFLESLQQGSCSDLKLEHLSLLRNIFNPAMCDRIEEGTAFVPPDPNYEYVAKVRNLVKDESSILAARKIIFFNKTFVEEHPGPEFPSAWTARFQVEKEGRKPTSHAAYRLVEVAADPAFQKFLLEDILPAAAPEFDKCTEDGVSFRIYRIGSLEIRTTQEQAGPETVGKVFSRRAPSLQHSARNRPNVVREEEHIVKADVYTEALEGEKQQAGKPRGHFYCVLETNLSNTIVTERLADGSMCWAVNSENLDDRKSLAKLLFRSDCKGTTVEGIMALQAKHLASETASATTAASRDYVNAIFQLVAGRGFRGKWGGMVKARAGKSVTTLPKDVSSEIHSEYLARYCRPKCPASPASVPEDSFSSEDQLASMWTARQGSDAVRNWTSKAKDTDVTAKSDVTLGGKMEMF
eukprot:TRINITY_DN2756_c0_g2_i2.p1 TRINITY_DN2756_c0_g2~~TRINITY_DN2756_c0_g2_i2.p1  ORF type:complete len:1138 (+),score=237.20 TRINITY_DN2756_c0_g2_i2:59-3472(+)